MRGGGARANRSAPREMTAARFMLALWTWLVLAAAATAQLDGGVAPSAPAPATLALRFGCPIVPIRVERLGPARFRVGNEERAWKMGEAWVFDDSINHEAWNDADALRVILIIDVWNPLLEPEERALVAELLVARKQFYEAGEGLSFV